MPNARIDEIEQIIPRDEFPTSGTILDDLKERVSSPFIFSYLVGFFAANWKIWVGLIFYSTKTLKELGYGDQISFIKSITNCNSLFWIPLASAVGYCFIYPFIRNFIKETQVRFSTVSNKRINKIAGESTIPARVVLELRNEYESKMKSAAKILQQDNSIIVEALQLENVSLQSRHRTILEQLEEWIRFNDVGILNGSWNIHHESAEVNISISAGEVFRRKAHQKQKSYLVTLFHCNPSARTLSVFLEALTPDEVHNLHGLHILSYDSMLELNGVIKTRGNVRWIRTGSDRQIG